MTSLPLGAVGIAWSALLLLAPAQAGAQQRSPAYGPRVTMPGAAGQNFGGRWGGRHGKHHGGFLPAFIVVEREVPVVVEREVVREVAAAVPPAPPPPPRKPYVVGASYASLPSGCLKMIEGTASYYFCGGREWYRQVGKQFLAVAKP